MSHVIVVGGGAAGMFAAIAAAKNGHQVTLYEKNERKYLLLEKEDVILQMPQIWKNCLMQL